jgi:Probable Zinc-ribbon domain
MAVAESIDAWWERRQRSKERAVPYPIGSYRSEWERYPVLIRQYHPDLNHGITLTQIPPAAEVYLSWQCEFGHVFVATPEEQRSRPGSKRRRSVWCPVCAQLADPPRVRTAESGAPARATRAPRAGRTRPRSGGLTPGDAYWSALAPKPASAAEGDLRHRLEASFEFDLACNAIAVSRPFFGRLEVWPDIVIPELRVAIEYDTVGRHGLEHVGPREKSDRQKDRALRAVRWEVIRVRCGKLQPLGPYDLAASGVTATLMARIEETLAEIRGPLIVRSYRRPV